MSSDLSWEHQFCLSCDRQTDGPAYCSESCRLSDFEKSSTTGSPASSPSLASQNFGWSTSKGHSKLYLAPAYDFSNAQPYGSTPRPQQSHSHSHQFTKPSNYGRTLTPSSSHSSLCSIQSTSSTGSEGRQLSEKSRKQLQDYASSFEHARLQRRRSY